MCWKWEYRAKYGHNLHYLHVSDICKGEEHLYRIITIYLVEPEVQANVFLFCFWGGGLQSFGRWCAQMVCSSEAFIQEESTKFQFQFQPRNRNEPRVINLFSPSWKVWMAFLKHGPKLSQVETVEEGTLDLNHLGSGNNTCCQSILKPLVLHYQRMSTPENRYRKWQRGQIW